MASKKEQTTITQRDVIRRNVTEIIKARGFSNVKQWFEMHNISQMVLYNQKNSNSYDSYGMNCKSLLRLCNELNVTPNDLLKGLY